ncbi:hypothetical protein DITRI_Ditri04bG0202100 [Diplodiscus trichospermus]
MATFFICPPYLSHPLKRTPYFSPCFPPPSPPPNPPSQPPASVKVQQEMQPKPVTTVETTDWIASSVSRRFGLGAGLACATFLAVGVISEQIKTPLTVSGQEANTREDEKQMEVVLPNGIRYYELRMGEGAPPRKGDMVVIDLKGNVEGSGEIFVDTFDGSNRPLALVTGSRPYCRGMCEGVEYVLRSMKAGGKRRVIIPPNLGFGEKGADLGSGVRIPPSATLEYIVHVDNVSVAPA